MDDFFIDGTTMFALTYSQLLLSSNGWRSELDQHCEQYQPVSLGVFKMLKVTTNVYAVYGVNGVYVSKDAGVNWVHISTANCNSKLLQRQRV